MKHTAAPALPRTALAAALGLLFAAPSWADTPANPETVGKKDLGTLKTDNSGRSVVLALSADGKTAAGWAHDDAGNDERAVIWSGDNWQTKTDLGTLKADNSGESVAYALSADGKTAAGRAAYKNTGNHNRAVIWSGDNWQNKTDIGTLKTDNSGSSEAIALSADGKTAAGWAHDNADNYNRAVIWSGDNWQTKTDLGTLEADNSGLSVAHALSADGKIAAGWAHDDAGNLYRAVIWSGDNWQTKTDLGTLKADNSGWSEALALSADGKIAAGAAYNEADDWRAVIWSGENWQRKTDLGTLKADNSGRSMVNVLSADGKIAAGAADNEANDYRAVIWSGDNWQTKTDLGTLKADNSGSSFAITLNTDGTVVGGLANSDNGSRAALWRVRYPDNQQPPITPTPQPPITPTPQPPVTPTPQPPVTPTPQPPVTPTPQPPVTPTPQPPVTPTPQPPVTPTPQPPVTPTPQPPVTPTPQPPVAPTPQPPVTPTPQPPVAPTPQPPVAPTPPVKVTPIDVENTRDSITLLGRDTLQTLNLQHAALQRLHHGCGFDGADASAKMCYRAEADVGTGGGVRDAALGMSLGYRFGKGFAAGVSFDRSLSRRLPESYRNGGNGNHGFALHGEWRGENWFARASGAWNDYRVRAVRPRLAGTEAGVGDSRMRGQSYRLIAGQDFRSDERRFGWYLGAEHGRVARKAYAETNAEFPVTYADASIRHNGLLFGWQGELAFSPKLSLLWDGDVMQPVKAKAAEYRAKGEYLGAFAVKGERPRTRIASSLGLQYRVSPALAVGVRPYWLHGTDGKHRGGVRAGLYGTF